MLAVDHLLQVFAGFFDGRLQQDLALFGGGGQGLPVFLVGHRLAAHRLGHQRQGQGGLVFLGVAGDPAPAMGFGDLSAEVPIGVELDVVGLVLGLKVQLP